MTRGEHIALLDRALASSHGIRLAYGDGRTAHRVRAKLYSIRDDIRAELRGKRQSDPAVTYDVNGKLLGIVDILRPKPRPASTPYDRLRLRIFEGDLFILPTEERLPVDALPPGEAREIGRAEASDLPPWPFGRRVNSY
jgi:hypothetical protein